MFVELELFQKDQPGYAKRLDVAPDGDTYSVIAGGEYGRLNIRVRLSGTHLDVALGKEPKHVIKFDFLEVTAPGKQRTARGQWLHNGKFTRWSCRLKVLEL